MTKYTIIDLHDFAKKKGGKCLSSNYINSHTKYLWEDHLGNQWSAKWYSILNGRWSPFLVKEKQIESNIKYSINDLKDYAVKKGGECLSNRYVNTKTYYEWLDSKGRHFSMTWDSILAGQWSPHEKKEKLSEIKRKYTIEDLHKYAERFNGKCLSSSYNKSTDIYEWETSDGRRFLRSWSKLKKSDTFCYYNPISNGHAEIVKFIQNDLGIQNISLNNRSVVKGIEFDILIPEQITAIEFNGAYWHSEANICITKDYHLKKYQAAIQNGFKLIQIFDFEWIHRKNQVKSYLRSALGQNKIKLNARDLEVTELNKEQAKLFLNDFHILGSCNFEKAYGFIINNEIQAMITIGRHHRNRNEYVLSRYCGRENVTIRGGLSKLTKRALIDFKVLTTWIDLRFSNGSSWIRSGWSNVHQLPPDYFYYNQNSRKIVSKQSRKKSNVGTDVGLTEHQHALNDGLLRIYDCGKLKLKIQ